MIRREKRSANIIGLGILLVAAVVGWFGWFGIGGEPHSPVFHAPDGPNFNNAWPDLTNTVEGRVAFNVPEKMKQGEGQRVTIRISANSSEDLSRNLANAPPYKTDKIRVAPYMTVKLKGDPEVFQIVALTPDDQFVAQDTFTQWLFDVKPLESGIQELNLLVGVRVRIGDSAQETRLDLFYERKLTVEVDRVWATMHFFGNNWKWIIGTILLPVIAWIIKQIRDKGKEKSSQKKEGLEFHESKNGEDDGLE